MTNTPVVMDHAIFSKKIESELLEIQVKEWLQAQGKKEPDQIPMGQLGLSEKEVSNEYKPGQQYMREAMTNSISKKRPVLSNLDKPLSREQLRHKFNHEAKINAIQNNQPTFLGKCDLHGDTEFRVYHSSAKHHCIACKQKAHEKLKDCKNEKVNG